MEDFVVSARKYRPQSFDTVVGQANITQTLVKAIQNNHLAQSFLFCGPRGVGKTTCARIMARTVNELSQEKPGEEVDYSFNIFELDAASNNGVEDIRNLIDQVRVPPQVGKYKVYIIDEVHMLSTGAFNAFLKTLEEPPAYAIFILATTEKHKVLPTILSRCQVFNFSRIEVSDIVSHLAEIAEKEGVSIGDDALHIIAEKADGALRDALSIFDQMVSFAGTTVSYQDVITNLNVLDYDYYFNITESFLASDRSSSLLTFNAILQKGFDGHNFINGLANHMRNLLFATNADTAALLETGSHIKERYLSQAAACNMRFVLNALNVLSEADVNYKQSKNQRLLVELALLKLCAIGEKMGEKKNPEHAVSDEINAVAEPTQVVSSPPKMPSPVVSQKSTDVIPQAQMPAPVEIKRQPVPESKGSTEPESPQINPDQLASAPQIDVSEPLHTLTEKPETQAQKLPAPSRASATAPSMNEYAEVAETTTTDTVKEDGNKKQYTSRLSGMKVQGMTSIKGATGVDKISKGTESTTGENLQDHSSMPSDDFNLAKLWTVWNEYAALVKDNDRKSYYATLMDKKPVMREKYKVELVIANEIQKKDLDIDKSNLLEYLRKNLNNWQIQLEGIVEEIDDDQLPAYSPEAKFKAMAERNPSIAKMKQLFDLDVDFDA